jgi:NAD(P)-dependent dehydrogenase (short-subunit alcohol dehydrogenase family)
MVLSMSSQHGTHEPLTPVGADVLSRFRLDGKVAIVTGGTRGIGLSIACTLARAGARVMVSSRKAEHVEAALQALRADGHDVHGLASNMGKPSDAHELAARTVEHFDGIDIIVNNAATNPIFGPLQQATADAFDKIFDVNVKGPFELCKTAHAIMVERGGGAIVNISSIGGVTPEAGPHLADEGDGAGVGSGWYSGECDLPGAHQDEVLVGTVAGRGDRRQGAGPSAPAAHRRA